MPPAPAKLSQKRAAELRLENQFQKWVGATASRQDIQDLLAAKRISLKQAGDYDEGDTADYPTYAKSLDALGKLVERRWKAQNIGKVTRQRIFSWKRSAKAAGHANFPKCKANGDYNVAECFEWIKSAVLPVLAANPKSTINQTEDNADYVRLIRKEDYEERVFARQLREGMHVPKAEYERVLSGLGKLTSCDLWERFDTMAYEMFANEAERQAMPEEWRKLALTILREQNPRLLNEHHAWVETQIETVRKETDENKVA